MRARHIATALMILVGATLVAPIPAEMDCPHPMDATIPALQDCVQHAADMGMITNAGVTNSLLSKLDAAQAAVDRNAPATAVNILGAFIHAARAQAGKHIDAAHAEHMAMHAEMVVAALSS
jgi:hypothetical protein